VTLTPRNIQNYDFFIYLNIMPIMKNRKNKNLLMLIQFFGQSDRRRDHCKTRKRVIEKNHSCLNQYMLYESNMEQRGGDGGVREETCVSVCVGGVGWVEGNEEIVDEQMEWCPLLMEAP
jgi:hypothetical protein